MTAPTVLPLILAASLGALGYAVVYHLVAGLKHPRSRQHLILSMVALFSSGFALTKLIMLQTQHLEDIATLNQIGLAFLVPIYPLLLSFFLAMANRETPWLWPSVAVGVALWIGNALQPLGLQFETVSGVGEYRLPWGERVSTIEGTANPWFALGLAWAMLLLGACTALTVQIWRQHRSVANALLLSMIALALSSLAGGLGRLGVLPLPQLGLYGLLAVNMMLSTIFIHDERRQRQREADSRAAANSRLAALFNAAPDGILIVDREGRIRAANPSCQSLFGLSPSELCRTSVDSLVPDDVTARHAGLRARFHASPRIRAHGDGSMLMAKRADGRILPVDIALAPLEWEDAPCTVAFVRDVSELTHTLERLRWLARHDELTGLPNLNTLAEQIEQHVQAARPFALALLGLDHLGRINDVVGYASGNEVLRVISGRVAALSGPVTATARFEGDKFALLLEDGADLQNRLRALMQLIGGPVQLADGVKLDVSLTAGYARHAEPSVDGHRLLQQAATALLFAKREARRGALEYQPEQLEHDRRWLLLASRMPAALAAGEFALAFQPRLRLRDQRCEGFEVLLRWNSPDGPISPAEFIRVAEESGFILELGGWVMAEAIRQAAAWQDHELDFGRIAINLSTRQLLDRELPNAVRSQLAREGLPAYRVEFEVTETAAMENVAMARPQLDALAELGTRLAMDDFGTGYSSLSYLQTLPFSIIKVDLSFTRRLGTRDGDTLMRSLLGLIKGLDRHAVAEGIETTAQLEWLRDAGFDEAQGYLLGRPMPAAQAEAWLRSHVANAAV
jgi:PAS domain S-box-containing protein/diguanylate cyclase (GGDEF)-like protein